jgi:uncharacterized iron-regulated membrane protein
MLAGLFIIITASSGIILNYQQPVFKALGFDARRPEAVGHHPDKQRISHPRFTTSAGLAAMPVSPDRALELAYAEWGDTPLERLELKNERGEWIYKLKQVGGLELWVNAVTGAVFAKPQYQRVGQRGADGAPVRRPDWGKTLVDLHTGKIGGEVGKAVTSLAALILLFLTASGAYLWAKPLLLRQQPNTARVRVIKTTRAAAPLPASARLRVPLDTSAG